MEKIRVTFNEITVNEWIQMRKEVSFPIFEEKIAQKALEGSLGVIGIKVNSHHIGMVRILGDGAYSFFLNDVIIIPSYQKKGLGKRLINEAYEFIRNNYCKESLFSISIFANPSAEKFYENVGFSIREEIPMKVFVRDVYIGSRYECLNEIRKR